MTEKKRSRKRRQAEPLKAVVVGPCKETEGADVAEVIMAEDAKLLDVLVSRFLAWPLPPSVCSDICVTEQHYKFPRSGTNLLTADEALQMLTHVLKGVRLA